MYVQKVRIKNFRCFALAEASLNYPGRKGTEERPAPRLDNVNLLIGDNGSGKSSVFQAVALGILAPVIASSGFKADYLVRREPYEQEVDGKAKAAEIHVVSRTNRNDYPDNPHRTTSESEQFADSASSTTTITRRGDFQLVNADRRGAVGFGKWSPIYSDYAVGHFVVGYGTHRRTENPEGYSEQQRKPRYQRVAGLFESQLGLAPFDYAAAKIAERGRLGEATDLINQLLPDDVQLEGLNFRVSETLLPPSELSDGFRTFVGWVWDLLMQMARLDPWSGPLVDIEGIVIVDEIDLFLHPTWQRTVVESLATTFPKIQFLFSTHSPLVAGTLEWQNIFVMDTDHNRVATMKQYRENIYGLSASQVLTSSYFGLDSTRAPGTGNLSDLAKRSANGTEADIAKFLDTMTQGIAPE